MSFLKNVRSRVFGSAVSELSVQEADVGDELAAAGKAFGTLMERVGIAVAQTQQQLDRNGAAIAEEMCDTEVDMIRARESIYDNDGRIQEVHVVVGKGKLIELAAPVFYEYQYVTLQGEFTATELARSTQSKVRGTAVSGSAGFGVTRKAVGIFKRPTVERSASASLSASASSSDTTSGSTFDSSAGTMRMNLLIAPKQSVAIPKPPLILEGPRIRISPAGPQTDAAGNRRTDVIITVTRNDGTTAVQEKNLAIETDGVDWAVAGGLAPKTNDKGVLVITLLRPQTPGDPPLAAKQVAVTVRLGLVSASATVAV